MILSALDVAQWTGRLAVFLDVRSMSVAAGVTWPTAAKSLNRLATQNWIVRLPNSRRHPRDAQVYVVNPAFPHVYKFRTSRTGRRHPQAGRGDPRLWGDFGVYRPESLKDRVLEPAHPKVSLVGYFTDPSNSYTHADTRRWLLIGRTETGVALGKAAVATYLALGDAGQETGQIAEQVRMPNNTVSRALHKLESLSLAYGQGRLWTAGMPIEQFDPDTLRVERRMGRIEWDRAQYAIRFPVSPQEWEAQELMRTKIRVEREFSLPIPDGGNRTGRA